MASSKKLPLQPVRKSIIEREEGATMVEFALSFLVFLLIIGVIIDGGMAVWRYSMLTDTINLVTIDRSINLDQNWGLAQDYGITSCGCGNGAIEGCATDITTYRLGLFVGVDPANIDVAVDQLNLTQTGGTGNIQMTATWTTTCWFCTLLGYGSFDIRATGTAPIEIPWEVADLRCPGNY